LELGEVFEVKLTPQKQLFYGNDFGIYACSTEQDVTGRIELDPKYNSFVITGQMPQLVNDKEYTVQLKYIQHKKYGRTLDLVALKQELPTTIAGQHAYLRSILSESQANLLINALPDTDIISQIKDDTLDYKSIKGIGDHTYNKIKDKIIENFEIQEALVELSQYGITYKMIKKLISHFGSSPQLVVQKVKENCYVLCSVSGLGFLKVDEYAEKMGIERNSPYRIDAAMNFILTEEEKKGHCWISKDKMIQQLCEITNLDRDVLINHVDNVSKDDFYIDDNRIGSLKTYKYESAIAECLLELLSVKNNFNVKDIDKRIKETEEIQGFEFTDEQKNAIYESANNNVIVISGRAGVGKSTILKGIMSVLDDYTYETCAFSGKASQRIIESTGLSSKTIHRMLDFKPHMGFTYNKYNHLPYQIIDLDEGSMVNSHIFYQLVTAIKSGSKLTILGDVEQLPPIGSGLVMKDMIDSGKIPVVELTQVHRQALKSGILLAANYVREGKQIAGSDEYETKVVGELKDLYIVPKNNGEEIANYIENLCEKRKDKLDIMDFQVIAPMKNKGVLGTKNLNIMLQEIFNQSKDEYGNDKISLKRNGYDYRVGDKIIKQGNDYESGESGVFNGTLGQIIEIDPEERLAGIQFVGIDGLVSYSQDDLDQIDMAYALTVHRVQGSEFRFVIFAFDYAAWIMLNRQLVYTGLTRASEKCVLVCEIRALRHAIRTNDSNKRNTFLKELLISGSEKINYIVNKNVKLN
jgi:exodeoxyribonuclease V alpha subunit